MTNIEAMKQPAEQEPVGDGVSLQSITHPHTCCVIFDDISDESLEVIEIELAEQEPVLNQRTSDCRLCGHCAATGEQLYTAPPQREWVGLTDDEIEAMYEDDTFIGNCKDIARAIEAKLKEKNNGK